MCLIAWCKTRHMADSEIELAWKANNDGAGVAWVSGNTVHYRRGLMRLRGLKSVLTGLRLPYVVHFRFATSGGREQALTHPFPLKGPDNLLSGKADSVLFHNGVWSEWKDVFISMRAVWPIGNGKWSDTRLMARIASLSGGDNVLKKLELEKLLILRENGSVYQSGKWETDNGVDFSNTYWNNRSHYGLFADMNSALVRGWDQEGEYLKGKDGAKYYVNPVGSPHVIR